jgi:DNA-binding transcriptional ArsR family regulator
MHAHSLDQMFMALADPHRRRMIDLLSRGPATAKQLAAPEAMKLPSAVKHLQVLEAGGIVVSRKEGRARTYSLETAAFRTIADWAAGREAAWNAAFDRLAAAMLETPQEDIDP